MKRIRLLLVGNHPAIRSGIRLLLKSIPEVWVVAEANQLRAALRAIEVHQPDVVLIDVPLPGRRESAGLKHPGLTRFGQLMRLNQQSPGVRVILLSEALRLILREGLYLSPAVPRRPAQFSVKRIKVHTTPTELTARQRQVLKLIADERNTKGIADALEISAKTVETHRAHLMQRLNIRSVAGLVRYAIATGFATLDKDCPSPRHAVRRAA